MAETSIVKPRLITLQTDALGWIGIQHSRRTIQQVKFGYDSHAALVRQFGKSVDQVHQPDDFERKVLDMFESFAAGETVTFGTLKVDESWMTPFQRKVVRACRRIKHGKTTSYGQLAEKAGSPRAARAVGTVMSSNRCPLIIPCHRVVSSSGLGGFTSHRGVSMKERLLQLESADVFAGT